MLPARSYVRWLSLSLVVLGACAVGSTGTPDARDAPADDRGDVAPSDVAPTDAADESVDVSRPVDVVDVQADVMVMDAVDDGDAPVAADAPDTIDVPMLDIADADDATDAVDASDASDVADVADVPDAGCRADQDCAGTVVGACHQPHCDITTGRCVAAPVADGTACDDGNACTQSDTCMAGTCSAGTPVTCAPTDVCHVVGICNPATGACSNPPAPNGTRCDDGNGCTNSDRCAGGVCAGFPSACNALDSCHVAGTCDPATGVCDNPLKADGATCDDGNACTSGDRCSTGTCTPGTPRVCTASDSCHAVGVCNPATGACSNPPAPDGTPCSDGDPCTRSDACASAVCVGGNPVSCPPPPGACLGAGRCDPSSGACAYAPSPDGTPCNDGDACTRSDSCSGGSCVGSNRVVCVSSDQCHPAGACDASTGVCSNPAASDATPCNDGDACTSGEICQSGVCARGTGACTTLVISEFRFRGPAGGSDEFVEVYNNTDAPLDISGWTLRASNNTGATGIRATVPAATTIPARSHYLFAHTMAVLSVTPDRTYTTGVTDDGGVAIARPDGTLVDQVGLSAGSAYREGATLAPLTTNTDRSYERRPGGATGNSQDTNDNATDFALASPSNPQNVSAPQTPAISVSPTFVYLGAAIGSSASAIVTVTNNASFAVTLTPPFTISGPAAGDFAAGAPGTTSLAPGASTTFSVTFTPSASGSRNATLSVSSTGGSPAVALTGAGS